MPKILQFKRYSSTTVQTSLGVEGELFVDLGKKTIAVMDGVTLGGSPLATEAQVTSVSSTLTTNYTAAVSSVSSVLTTNYTSSVSNVSSVLTTNYKAADSAISSNVNTVSSNLTILSSNTWRAATTTILGLVRADGTSIVINSGLIRITPTFTGGFQFTSYSLGNTSGASITPNSLNGNYQFATNNGAGTINAPTADCAIDLLLENTSGAGTITLSGFTVVTGNIGDALTTTTTAKFIISIRRINAVSTYIIKQIAT